MKLDNRAAKDGQALAERGDTAFPDAPLNPPDSERSLTLPERLARARRHPDAEPADFDDEGERGR